MANIFDKIGDWFSGEPSSDYTKQAMLLNALNANEAQKELSAVDTKTDDVRTLSNKARETAGQQAGDKAGIAKKQAKAASAMQGGSRLLNAINASSAAANAATEGYDEAQNRSMNIEATRQQADVGNRLQKAQNKVNARQNAVNSQIGMMTGMDAAKTANKQKEYDRLANVGNQVGQMILQYGMSGSDEDTKEFFKRMVKVDGQ